MARILIIDDEELVRLTLRDMLEQAGHDVVEAVNGEEGINLHRQNPADLIITDIIMPEKEGIETIMELRGDNSEVKIIAISGGGRMGDIDYLKFARHLGVQHVLAKPFGMNELQEAVLASLSMKPLDH